MEVLHIFIFEDFILLDAITNMTLKNNKGSSSVAQRVKDPALSLQWPGLLLWWGPVPDPRISTDNGCGWRISQTVRFTLFCVHCHVFWPSPHQSKGCFHHPWSPPVPLQTTLYTWAAGSLLTSFWPLWFCPHQGVTQRGGDLWLWFSHLAQGIGA